MSDSEIMYMLFFVLLFSVLETTLVTAFATGPPIVPGVCLTLDALGHRSFFEYVQVEEFEITTDKDWFVENESLNITVTSTTGSTFRGLMMQVRDSREDFAGSFAQPSDEGLRILNCDWTLPYRLPNTTVSHSDNRLKSSATFVWTAPPSCDGTGYHVRATVVKERGHVQDGITKTLECRPSTDGETDEEVDIFPVEILLDEEERQCSYPGLTNIPLNKYNTSFETYGDTAGWNSTLWSFQQGETLSSDTGPLSAADGNYYLYLESSFPTRPLQRATLQSDADLRGCFCLKLMHSHNVENYKQHKFMVYAGSQLLYETENKQEEWRDLSFQIDTDEFISIQIIGVRGSNYRGDMAVDNIRLSEGLCPRGGDEEAE